MLAGELELQRGSFYNATVLRRLVEIGGEYLY